MGININKWDLFIFFFPQFQPQQVKIEGIDHI